MGDLAEDIAERAIHLSTLRAAPVARQLQRMTDLTTMMVRQSLDAFVNLDVQLARRVAASMMKSIGITATSSTS